MSEVDIWLEQNRRYNVEISQCETDRDVERLREIIEVGEYREESLYIGRSDGAGDVEVKRRRREAREMTSRARRALARVLGD